MRWFWPRRPKHVARRTVWDVEIYYRLTGEPPIGNWIIYGNTFSQLKVA